MLDEDKKEEEQGKLEDLPNKNYSKAKAYCITCKVEGRITELFYSKPPKSTDTWKRMRERREDLRCNQCVKKYRPTLEKKVNKKTEKQRLKEQRRQERIRTFSRLWNDPTLIEMPWEERLMEVFIRNGADGIRNSEEGFTYEEVAYAIYADKISFSLSGFAESWRKNNSERHDKITLNTVANELVRALSELEEDISINRAKRLTHYAQRLVSGGNKNPRYYLMEKLVVEPGYQDVLIGEDGQKYRINAPRLHLLTKDKVRELRERKMRTKISSITNIIDEEKTIQTTAAQSVLEREKAKQPQQSTSNNT